ncbi:unnamed protein product [Arabis nemorensis]|uniref:Uncharacterized protein n=1 Tax=Arabis nemorensis TaxID=586526 RepID=A0A565AN79_9BRAS|nr:unnamed protein product [Arabis nemorensis]
MVVRKALESVSRWLARKGPRERTSPCAGGSSAEPESALEIFKKVLMIAGVMTVYGPDGAMLRLIEAREKEAKEAKEAEEAKAAQDLPK